MHLHAKPNNKHKLYVYGMLHGSHVFLFVSSDAESSGLRQKLRKIANGVKKNQ